MSRPGRVASRDDSRARQRESRAPFRDDPAATARAMGVRMSRPSVVTVRPPASQAVA